MKVTNRIDLDAILVEIGELGRYQIVQYTILSLLVVCTSTSFLSYVFTAGQLDYRCRIPEIDTFDADGRITYMPDWLPAAVPYTPDNKPERCSRYQTIDVNTITPDARYACVADVCFNTTQVERCNDFVFATDEVTLINAFNITCPENDWLLAIVGTLGGVATLIVLPICALISDRYGRRPVIVYTVLLSGICGLIKSWSTSYVMFASMEFVTSMASGGTYMTIYVLAIEFAGPTKRVFSGTLISVVYSFSQALNGVLAMLLPDFRTYLRVLFGPFFAILAILWLMPESVRWLLVKGDVRRARKILLRAASVNGRTLSPAAFESLHRPSDIQVVMASADVEHSSSSRPPRAPSSLRPNAFALAIRSRSLLLRLAICLFGWFTISFIYYGMTVHATALVGNKYVNYMLVSLVEVPAVLAASALMVHFGRKRVQCVCLLLTGVACVSIEFMGDDGAFASAAKLVVYVLGKSGVTIAFTVMYVFTTEMFPTAVRHSFMNACSTFGSIGALLAPMTPLLAQTWSGLPLILFGGSSLMSGLLVLLLPETSNTALPDTVEEAEELAN